VLAQQNGFATRAENAGLVKQLTLLVKRTQGVCGERGARSGPQRRVPCEGHASERAPRRMNNARSTFSIACAERRRPSSTRRRARRKQHFGGVGGKITFAIELNQEESHLPRGERNILQSGSMRLKEASDE